MEYTTLGRTGRQVSRIGFGGATAGLRNYLGHFDPDQQTDRERVLEAIRTALDLGINYFDTAAGYGDGASERLFGEALAGADPAAIFLATKAGPWNWRPGEVRRSLERSLKNLRRAEIDLLQVHGTAYPPPCTETILRPGGMLEEMEALREEGLVRHLGFTIETEGAAMPDLLDSGRFEVVQLLYNLLFQHPCDPGWKCGSLYQAEKAGMGTVTMRSTTSGQFQRWIQMVNPANTFDYTPALIQFQLSNPLVDVALIGMRDPETVRLNVAIADDTAGHIDLDALFRRYVAPQGDGP